MILNTKYRADPDLRELQGHVATVYTNPLSMGSSSNAHYGGNAKTYMNVGLGMGGAMVELLKGGKSPR